MDLLKRKRSALAGSITRIFNKLKGSDAAYLKVHDTILEEYADAINPDEEQDILEQHEEAVDKTLSLISRLISLLTHTEMPLTFKND